MSQHGDTLSPSGRWIQLLATVVQQFPRHISPAQMKYLNGHPSAVGTMLARVFVPMFISPAEQFELVRQRNAKRGWGFTDEDFSCLGEPPAWPDDDLYAVVLEVSLDSIQQTFEEAWLWAAEAQRDYRRHRRWPELSSDERGLRLLVGIEHKRGLRWRVVDLGANWDKKDGIAPRNVRDPKRSPHSAILWAAALFPAWVRAIDGVNVPNVWIPGYEASVSDHMPWTEVPRLQVSFGNGEVSLDTHSRGSCFGGLAVPEFRE